jgi:CBS domain-containing protein
MNLFWWTKNEDAITEVIFKNTKNNTLFYDFLGNDALKELPLSFQKINCWEEGPNEDKFDIKREPYYSDGARLFALSNEIKGIKQHLCSF